MEAPDLTGLELPFEPEQHWVNGNFDPAALIASLKAQPQLADFGDDAGDQQSAVRLDPDPEDHSGFWVAVPTGTGREVIDNALAAYQPPPEPSPPGPSPLEQLLTAAMDATSLEELRAAIVAYARAQLGVQ